MIPGNQRLSRIEAARHLGITLKTLDQWCRLGLRGVRLARSYTGGRVFFHMQDIKAFQAEVDRRRRPEVPLSVQKRKAKESVERCWRLLGGRKKDRNGTPSS